MKILHILLILISICITFEVINYLNGGQKEKFIVLQEDTEIPYNCPEYIYTDGQSYYLYNSRKKLDGVKNPMKFDTITAAEKHHASMKCPRIPLVDLVVKKDNSNLGDPQVTYERDCNKHISPFDHQYEKYSYEADSIADIREYQKKVDREQVNYDLESCMLDRVKKENPELLNDNNKTIKNYYNKLENFVGKI
jgi:hypothetical protein